MKRILAVITSLLISSHAFADSLGSAVGGTAANQSSLSGGLCLSAPVAISNGQQRALLADCTTGALLTESAGGLSGGYEFNASATPTVQNASYSAGQSLGGLQTISIGATNSLTGILTQIQLSSKGGSVVASVIYVWQKNPTGTTCTDRANFVASATDNQALIVQPQLLTPSVVLSAQDTFTYAAATNLIAPFANGSTNTSLYVCIVANGTVTPGTTSDLRVNIQGVKDQT